MSIIFSLHKNPLPTAPEGSYRAIVRFRGTVNMDKVFERVLERNPGLTLEVAQATVQLFHSAMYSYVLDGYQVVTPFGIVGAGVRGNFAGPTDSFDHSRHSVEATLSPGADLQHLVHEKAQVEQQEAHTPRPKPVEYVDWPNEQINRTITPGRVAQVNGYRLKFDPADPRQGLFFIAADGSESRPSLVIKNSPRQLIFEVPPDLAPGDYTIEVRSTLRGDDLRTGSLPVTLTVP